LRFGGDKLLEYSDIILDGITQDTEMQKKVYLLGVLLGNGIKTGIGLKGGSGKFKMTDLLGMALPKIFPQLFGGEGKEQKPSMSPFDIQNLNK